MYALLDGLSLFLIGIADSVNPYPKYVAIRSARTRSLLYNLFLNAFLLLVSVGSFEWIILPLLVHFKRSLAPTDSIFTPYLIDFFESFSRAIFYYCWVYPMYFMWMILIPSWHEDLAKHTYELSQKERRPLLKPLVGDQKIEEAVLRILFTLFFIFQKLFFSYFPFIGVYLDLFIASIYYSFLFFEPRWRIENVPFYQNSKKNCVDIIHSKWPYFFGFGLPLCCLVKAISFPFPDGIYISLLPLVIQRYWYLWSIYFYFFSLLSALQQLWIDQRRTLKFLDCLCFHHLYILRKSSKSGPSGSLERRNERFKCLKLLIYCTNYKLFTSLLTSQRDSW